MLGPEDERENQCSHQMRSRDGDVCFYMVLMHIQRLWLTSAMLNRPQPTSAHLPRAVATLPI
jgi:hypothetical protein